MITSSRLFIQQPLPALPPRMAGFFIPDKNA